MIHTILFLSAFVTFNLWLTTNSGTWKGRPWGSLSAIGFLCYLFGFLFGNFSFWQVISDLILLLAGSFVINIFTGRYFIALPLIALISGTYYYVEEVYRAVPDNTFVIQRKPNSDDTTVINNVILPTDLASNGEVFIVLKPDYNVSSLSVVLNRFGISKTPERAFEMLRGDWTDLDDVYTIDIPDDKTRMVPSLVKSLEQHAAVKAVEVNENILLSPLESYDTLSTLEKEKAACNDPLIHKQWAYDALKFDEYYQYIQSQKINAKKKIRLAIIDTGIDGNHEDLKNHITAIEKDEEIIDIMGHGTHCAGIAAAITNNKTGIASLIPSNDFVEIISFPVFDEYGRTSQQKIVAAMLKAVDLNCQVISMSLGGPINTEAQYIYGQAINYANKKGAIIVVAAGNENMDASERVPAGLTGVITVTAIDKNLKKANFSNHIENIKMPIAAPGVDIYSTLPNNTYDKMSGTSMATPYVAGLVVILKSIKPKLSTAEVHEILLKTAIRTAEFNSIGGIIQPKRALKYALTGSLSVDEKK